MPDAVDIALVVSRFFHFAALIILFGSALFPIYAYGGLKQARAEPDSLFGRRRYVLVGASLAALLSAVCWFFSTAAGMSGSFSSAVNPSTLSTVAFATEFGRLWLARGVLLIVLACIIVSQRHAASTGFSLLTLMLAGVALATLTLTGHAGASDDVNGSFHRVSDEAHLLAAGMWLGGLPPLAAVLATGLAVPGTSVDDVLARFSSVGQVAVAVLMASGVVNSWFLVGSVHALFATPYGRLLAVKIILFLMMALLALANRFWLMPRLKFDHAAVARLRRHIVGEQILGVLVLVIVSVLGTLEPASIAA